MFVLFNFPFDHSHNLSFVNLFILNSNILKYNIWHTWTVAGNIFKKGYG